MDGIGFGYDLYYQKHNLSKTSNIFEYSTDTWGGSFSWSMPVSLFSSSFLGFGYNKIKLHVPQFPPLEVKDFVSRKGYNYEEYVFNIGWRYNSLDRYIFPTEGLSQRLNLKYNLPNSKLKYYVVNYDCSWFKPITTKYIFNFSSDISYGRKYGTDPYPFFKNSFMGGADTVRGFEDRSLGPHDSQGKTIGGNLAVNFKTSIIFPVPFREDIENIRPSVFMDFGQVYDTYKSYNRHPNSHLRYSTGVSVAINTPLGVPVVLSLAKPLNSKTGDKKETFSFTFAANY
jgi:outer membrane protein insertion porin family